jgi:hypothetical protein
MAHSYKRNGIICNYLGVASHTYFASPAISTRRREAVMPTYFDFPTCFVCRSIELEIVNNDDFGPMTLCGECGYSWIAKYEDISPIIVKNIA